MKSYLLTGKFAAAGLAVAALGVLPGCICALHAQGAPAAQRKSLEPVTARGQALSDRERHLPALFAATKPLAIASSGNLASAAFMTATDPVLQQAIQQAAGQNPPEEGARQSAPQADKGLSVNTSRGFGIFQQTCLKCHGTAAYRQAPSPEALRNYPPERIYAALTTGAMKAVGDTLTDTQKRLVSESVAGRLLGTSPQGDASKMANPCPANPPMMDPSVGPEWNGWGNNLENTRFQSAAMAGLTPAELPRLKLKWAFGLPNSTSSYSQPTVVSERVFIGTDTGYVYSLDAKSGCVHWSFLADAGVRNALIVQPITEKGTRENGANGQSRRRYAAYFGDLKANVYAIDAQTGRLIWKTHVDDQYTTRITAPPAFYRGHLFVPVSSWEEFSARSLDYPCCTSVGSVVALDAATGHRLWKTYVIPDRPQPVRKNFMGVQQYAPAGASVWNTPTVDAKLGAIYFGTGDATTYPAAKTSDAMMALDMKSGRMLWSYQVEAKDSFLVGCRGSSVTENCPAVEGPDWDIPCSPILANLGGGRRLILVATKQGDILALDPDHSGALVWRMNVAGELASGQPLPQGIRRPGVMWGGAVEGQNLYYGLTNGGGVVAIQVPTGKRIWTNPLKADLPLKTDVSDAPKRPPVSYGAPATVIPGAVFVGGTDGNLIAVSTSDGSVLWSFDTDREFDTVNQVPAHGGSFGSQGITVVGGMLFAGSGYGYSQSPGNVVLAFSRQ